MKQPRSVGMCIVLSLITCGIYAIYWMYCIHNDVQEVSGTPLGVSGGMVVVLDIITCGIYGVYWNYKMGQLLDNAKGVPNGNSAILYLVLALFGFGIVSMAIMQSELNHFETGVDGL